MHGFAVNRFGGNDLDVRKHHVSLLCPLTLSVIENFDLPFDKDEDEYVHSGSCGSLLYFIAGPHFAKIVIWNTTTKQFIKVLDPPDSIPGHRDVVAASGLGYDAKSRQYKLVRYSIQCPVNDNGHITELTIRDSYFDLYSFKYGTWNKLKKPFADIKFNPHIIGVNITRTGSCYWTARVNGLPDEPRRCVLSFDFATEDFDRFPLPAPLGPATQYRLVECYGYLGALVYCHEDELSPLDVEVFVRRGTEWDRIYAVSFDYYVARPLGLKDDRLLFLEAEERGGRTQLLAYDLVTQTHVKVDNIKDFRADLDGVCYAATTGISYAKTTGISYAEATGISYAETTDPDSIPVPMISPNKEKEKKKKKQEKKKRKKKEKKQQQQQEKEKEKEKEEEEEEKEKEKDEKEKDEKQQQQEEEKIKKEEEENRSHIPHSWTRTSLVKACNGIEEVEHVALREISINIY